LPSSDEKVGFNATLFHCIDAALNSFGEGAKRAFYYQVEQKYKFREEDFSKRPQDLIKYIQEILGVSGSKTFERILAKQISSSFNIKYKSSDNLNALINEAQSKFLLG
jgi:hypothetical protein